MSTVILSEEQVAEARAMREPAQDKTYGQIAKHFGVDVETIQHAIAGTGDYAPPEAPKSALDRLQEAAEAQAKRDDVSDDPDVRAAGGDRKLTEAEIDQLEAIYRTGMGSFEEMAAALDPPVNWLTVQDAISARGWYRWNQKTLTYSTATEEGKARFARESAMGIGLAPVAAAIPDSTGPTGDAGAEARARTAEKAAAKAAQMAGAA